MGDKVTSFSMTTSRVTLQPTPIWECLPMATFVEPVLPAQTMMPSSVLKRPDISTVDAQGVAASVWHTSNPTPRGRVRLPRRRTTCASSVLHAKRRSRAAQKSSRPLSLESATVDRMIPAISLIESESTAVPVGRTTTCSAMRSVCGKALPASGNRVR